MEQIGKQLLIWVICVNIHIELTAAESFVSCTFIICFPPKRRSLWAAQTTAGAWELVIDLKLVAYVGVEIEDRNLELTCLTPGKGDWKTVNHFPSFDSFMSAILFHISHSFSSLIHIQKEQKFQNKLSKVNSHVQHPPMIGTHFVKLKGI